MSKEKSNDSILSESIAKFFKGKNFGFLGTVNKNGSPQVTPTWIDMIENEGGHEAMILINTAKDRVKQKNVSRDPRIALAIIDQDNQYEMVTVRGKVTEQITGDVAEKHIDKLAKKYLNLDKYPRRLEGEQRVILRIRPEKIFHMK
jgi:PPOX class probable F420-dependent enzyme